MSLTLLPLIAACATPQGAGAPAPTVKVGLLAINDFHGALEMPRQSVFVPDGKGEAMPVPAGGAAYLASAIDSLKAQHPNHLVVSAGDLIGASQLSSALFLDEPTIEVMNRIGLDFNAAALHAQQFILPAIELVIAGGVEVQPDAVHHLDCRLVQEQRRGEL
ncbi:MAG: hypothetical protein ACK44Y_06725 [Novosphingobium sp.]